MEPTTPQPTPPRPTAPEPMEVNLRIFLDPASLEAFRFVRRAKAGTIGLTEFARALLSQQGIIGIKIEGSTGRQANS